MIMSIFQTQVSILISIFEISILLYILYTMRKNIKNKLSFSDKQLFSNFIYKRRHQSSTTLQDNVNKLAAFEVIELLLERLFQDQRKKEKQAQYYLQQLKGIQTWDSSYFKAEFQPDTEILCIMDEEPLPESKLNLIGSQVIPKKLKKVIKVRESSSIIDSIQENESTFLQKDKKNKQYIIQKMKKQYTSILHQKYVSQSLSIDIQNGDTTQDEEKITLLRKIYENQQKLRHHFHKKNNSNRKSYASYNYDEETKSPKQKLKGIKKVNKNKQNKDSFKEINLNNIDNYLNSRRQSFTKILYYQTEDHITVKESNMKETKMLFTKQKVVIRNGSKVLSTVIPMTRASTFHSNSNRQYTYREQLKKQLQSSFISSQHTRLTQLNNKDIEKRNSNYVSFLPKIIKK